jgi:hypothetical protein
MTKYPGFYLSLSASPRGGGEGWGEVEGRRFVRFVRFVRFFLFFF